MAVVWCINKKWWIDRQNHHTPYSSCTWNNDSVDKVSKPEFKNEYRSQLIHVSGDELICRRVNEAGAALRKMFLGSIICFITKRFLLFEASYIKKYPLGDFSFDNRFQENIEIRFLSYYRSTNWSVSWNLELIRTDQKIITWFIKEEGYVRHRHFKTSLENFVSNRVHRC